MATNYSPKIVTDQLAIVVDVASKKCYSGSGSTVTGFINGNSDSDAKLSFSGNPLHIVNDGSGGELNFSQSTNWATTSFTFSAWGNRDDLNESREGRMCDQLLAGNGHLRMSLFSTSSSLQFRPAGGGSTNLISSSTTISAGRWYNLVVTKEGTTSGGSANYAMYINGVQVATSTSSALVTSDRFTQYKLMRSADDDQSGTSWLGKFGPFHAYTKALSAVEVSQNFNALRGRFGI
tara:strand:+ start:26 stop:730 length:705 start_codon:yes stop_codon:yes gene_type:complete